MSGFSTIQSAVDSLARGEVIIVVDAEDRENEGDFICAAEKATTETINFVLGESTSSLSIRKALLSQSYFPKNGDLANFTF